MTDNNENMGSEVHKNREELLDSVANSASSPESDQVTEQPKAEATEANENTNEDNSIGDLKPPKPLTIKSKFDLPNEEPILTLREPLDLEKLPVDRWPVILTQPNVIVSSESDLEDIDIQEQLESRLKNNDSETFRWISAINSGMILLPPGSTMINALCREGAEWANYIPSKGGRITYRANPNIRKNLKGGEQLTNNVALDMFFAKSKSLRTTQVPLYRTGIWVKMQAPNISYLSEIDRALALVKGEIGLNTNGTVDSNEDVKFREILFDAALRLVSESTYPYRQSPLELKSIISDGDIDTLIWGMAVAAYANGHDVGIPCVNAKCANVDTYLASPARMRVVDRRKLSEWQITHMSKGMGITCTEQDLITYESEFEESERDCSQWKCGDDIFVFGHGSVENYMAFANMWFNSINLSLEQSMGNSYGNPQARIQALNEITEIETLCRYGHFVKEIRIKPDDPTKDYSTITDPDTIRRILKGMYSDQEQVEGFLNAIENFLEKTIITVFGIRNKACTKCGSKRLIGETGEELKFVPIKVGETFFTLLQHRLVISGREPLADLTTLGITVSGQPTSANEFMSELPE